MNATLGANEDGYHYQNANLDRDFKALFVDLRTAKEGELAPDGQGQLNFGSRDRNWSHL